VVKQDKSFLFLTQFTGFPGDCLETVSAKAYPHRTTFHAVEKLVRQLQAGPVIVRRTRLAVLSRMARCIYVPLHVKLCVHPYPCLTLGTDPPNRAGTVHPAVAPLFLAEPPPAPQRLPRDAVVFASFAFRDNY